MKEKLIYVMKMMELDNGDEAIYTLDGRVLCVRKEMKVCTEDDNTMLQHPYKGTLFYGRATGASKG